MFNRRRRDLPTTRDFPRSELANTDSDYNGHIYKPPSRKRDVFIPESRLGIKKNPKRWRMPLPDSAYLSNHVRQQPETNTFPSSQPGNYNATVEARARVRKGAYSRYCAEMGNEYLDKAYAFVNGVLPEWQQFVQDKPHASTDDRDLLRPDLSEDQQYERLLAAPFEYLVSKYLQAADIQGEHYGNAKEVKLARAHRLACMTDVFERASHELEQLGKETRPNFGLPKIARVHDFGNSGRAHHEHARTPSTQTLRGSSSNRTSPTFAD
ncbi:hypothetical protein JCM5353_000474 [Sporobolomyces roseus]